MNKRVKHSKIKNTGILFELLSRQITQDIITDDKKSKSVSLLKRFFNENTEIGKENQLYQILIKTNYNSNSKAQKLIEAVLKSRSKVNNKKLRQEKYNLIKSISENYKTEDFFRSRIPNYKVYASIYKLFESVYTQDPKEETESRFTIIENITKKSTSVKKKDKKVLENYKKQEKDLRLLTYTVLVEKFNKKYKKLTESQRDLLRKYIYNISNTNSLKEFIEKESIQIKKQLQSFLPKIDDKVTKIKLTEAINQIGNLLKGRIVEDNQVVALMRYYQLVRELKDVSK